jgi:hypothetical protein
MGCIEFSKTQLRDPQGLPDQAGRINLGFEPSRSGRSEPHP